MPIMSSQRRCRTLSTLQRRNLHSYRPRSGGVQELEVIRLPRRVRRETEGRGHPGGQIRDALG